MAVHSEPEGLFVRIRVIAAGAPPTDHRVLFMRLKNIFPEQVGISIALEIAETHDHFYWDRKPKDLGDAAN